MNIAAATLGGLFHDIGKFAQRATGERRTHTEAGAEFFVRTLAEKVTGVYGDEVSLEVERAIRCHHDHTEVITLADCIAAGERFDLEQEETLDPRETLLVPIWAGVTLEGTNTSDAAGSVMPLTALPEEPEAFFPLSEPPEDTAAAYAHLWRSFEDAASSLSADERLIDRCLGLLEKFTWCIPSAAYRSRPDVSLFDHLRLTAAVAACLSKVERPNIDAAHFLLVMGDLSGIQSYLFALRGTGASAKRLRARSHRISRLAEDAASRILEDFGLYRPNLLISAGGRFYLLLPFEEDAAERLSERQREFDARSLDEFGGLLSVQLAWLRCTGKDLRNFGPIRRELERRVRLAKSRPLASVAQKGATWDEGAFVSPRAWAAGEEPCPVCGLRPVSAPREPTDEPECEHCRRDRELGREIARRGPHYVPHDETDGTVTEFTELANRSTGRPYLGVLKGDIDRLGRILDRGLAAPDRDGSRRLTLSRLMAASRSLDWFFTRWLPSFLRREHPYIYTVYAGGDDLLLVGPWDDVVGLADDLERNLRRYLAGNPALTWSAGITVCHPHTPIHLAIDEADRLLNRAKETDAFGRAAAGRNQVACLGTVLPWAHFARALPQARRLGGWARQGTVSSGILRSLMQAGRLQQRFRSQRDVEALRWVPLLAYQIGRHFPEPDRLTPEQKEAYRWLVELKQAGMRDLPAHEVTDLDCLRFIADFAAYYSWQEEPTDEPTA